MADIIFDGPEQIAFFQLAARKGALKLWINTGMQMQRGGAILSTCKKAYGLTGNKHQILAQMEQMIEDAIAAR